MLSRREVMAGLSALLAPQAPPPIRPIDPPPKSVREALLAAPLNPRPISSVVLIPTQVIELVVPLGMADRGKEYNRTDRNQSFPNLPTLPNAQLQWAHRLGDLLVLHYWQGGFFEAAVTRVIEAPMRGRPVVLWTLSHNLPGLADFAALQAEVRRVSP
jgi:hypothetical protein